jgi:hypothetical protein
LISTEPDNMNPSPFGDTTTKGMNDPADALAFRPHTVERAHISKHAAGRTKPVNKKTKERRRRQALKVTTDAALDASALRRAIDG